ncbi:MAG: hypothetical protein AB7E47_14485 [Desulfovibrionaceae bacterium]
MKHLCIVLAWALLMGGCSSGMHTTADILNGDTWHTNLDLSGRATRYVDEQVQLPARPDILVHPATSLMRPPSAVFFPLRVLQDMPDRQHMGREIGRVFWKTWLRGQVFPTFEYAQDAPWNGAAKALATARAMGAELAVGGDITYLYASGTAGDSEMAMRLEIYDVASGELIWSMEHSGMMTERITQDYILFMQKSRLPASPLYAITSAIATDMAAPVKEWIAFSQEQAASSDLM